MDTKLPATFWTDPEFDKSDSDVLLAALWIKTNDRLDLLGFAEISPRAFTFQTRLPFKNFERACEALGKGLVREGNRYWLRGHVREQYGCGPSLVKNHMRKPLVRALELVGSPSIRAEIENEYPELVGSEIIPFNEGLSGLPKPKNRTEQSREEKSSTEQHQGGPGETRPGSRRGPSTRPSEHPEPMRSRMIAVGEIKGRRADSVWSDPEKKALAAAGLLELEDADFNEQIEAMLAFYRATIPVAKEREFWKRTTLPTLLSSWPSELDKARAWRRTAGGEGDGVRKVE
jgi:hypothetical protein